MVTVAHRLLDQPPVPGAEHPEQRYALHPVVPKDNARRSHNKNKPKTDDDERTKTPFAPADALLDKAMGRKPASSNHHDDHSKEDLA